MTTQVPRRRAVRPVPAPAQPACRPVQALARIRLAPCLSRQVFEEHLRTIPAVRSAAHVIGDVDYEVRLACGDLADLGVVLASLRDCKGTQVVSTALVLGEVEGLGRRARSIRDWGTVPRPGMVGCPPVVAVRDGTARLLVRRETDSDLLLRDVGI